MASERERVDVAMVLPHLGPGGSQRVASILLNEWHRKALKCLLVTTYGWPEDAYTLDPGVERVVLFPTREDLPSARVPKWLNDFLRVARTAVTFVALLTRAVALRRVLKRARPRAVVAFLSATNVTAVLATRGMRTRLIISERNDPSRQKLDPPWDGLRQKLYRRADVVTTNNRDAMRAMEGYVPTAKLQFVPNPLHFSPDCRRNERREPVFLAVGRLLHQKGFDIVLRAFARIAAELPEWHLEIVGDGPLREELERQAAELGVAQRVVFHGHRSDVAQFYRRASVFVLPSRFEGMPNALLEAMMFALPSVVTDGSLGPVELVEGGAGLVVPVEDPAALAEAMRSLASNGEHAGSMGQTAQAVAERHDVPRVLALWTRLLFSAA